MAAIFQTTLSNAFSWLKIYEFRLRLKFVPKSPINNIPALVEIMAWRRPGDKPLFEPMMSHTQTPIYASLGLNGLIWGQDTREFSKALLKVNQHWSIMNTFTSFAMTIKKALSGNMQRQLDKLEARKMREFNETWPKFNQAYAVPQWFRQLNSMSIHQRFYSTNADTKIRWPGNCEN